MCGVLEVGVSLNSIEGYSAIYDFLLGFFIVYFHVCIFRLQSNWCPKSFNCLFESIYAKYYLLMERTPVVCFISRGTIHFALEYCWYTQISFFLKLIIFSSQVYVVTIKGGLNTAANFFLFKSFLITLNL